MNSKARGKAGGKKAREVACLLLVLNLASTAMLNVMALPGDEHDIAVDDIFVPLYAMPLEFVSINATIKNLGINYEANIRINLLVNGVVDDWQVIPSLDSGQHINVSFDWVSGTRGFYKIGVEAVPLSYENDLTNNLLESNLVVTTGPKEGTLGLISTENELQGLESILFHMNVNYKFYD
ncbi:MAG: hypothetical protein JSW28_06545 [Thermoplasmata archaeon]|nr:MAG: hypothetical protein JSW28_06545 [Thermoplasmata archaeon]